MRTAFVIFSLLLGTIVGAQDEIVLDQTNADSDGAVLISDSIFGPTPRFVSFGNVLEIKDNPRDDKRYFEREHNVTWFKFRPPWDGDLTMDIIPENTDDDFDFLLFRAALPGFSKKIMSKEHGPVRSNISRNDPSLGSRCGLSHDAADNFVRSGVGASYSKALPVKQGELLYLVVDNPKRPISGYTIHLHFGPNPDPQPEEPENSPSQILKLKITDSKTGNPVEADLGIEGIKFDRIVYAKGKSAYNLAAESYKRYRIACVKKGYMFYNAELEPSLDPVYDFEVKLDPIEAGSSITLENIQFVGNAATVLRSSEISLFQLMNFMLENETVKIEIQGHVNGPTFKNKKEFVELSTSRAKTIFDFLLVNDIEPERMTYKGFGNSAMIYPNPKNRKESEANRRVEIKVLSK